MAIAITRIANPCEKRTNHIKQRNKNFLLYLSFFLTGENRFVLIKLQYLSSIKTSLGNWQLGPERVTSTC